MAAVTFLTDQQEAILTEGICPLCYTEVQLIDADAAECLRGKSPPQNLLSVWECIKCDIGFKLSDTVENSPHAVSNAYCANCGKSWVAVYPVKACILECPRCKHPVEVG